MTEFVTQAVAAANAENEAFFTQLNNADATEAFFAQSAAMLHEAKQYDALLFMMRVALPKMPDASVAFFNDYAKIVLNVTRDATLYADMLDALLPRMGQSAELVQDVGSYYALTGAYDKAVERFDRALELDPDLVRAKFSKAQILLMRSEFKEGLDLYDARFEMDIKNTASLDAPRWQGEDLNGKHLFIWGEQGVGDIVMFASLLPALQTQFKPAKITLSVFEKMVALFQRSFPDIHVIPIPRDLERGQHYDLACDVCMPLGDVLRYVLPHSTPANEQPQGFLKANTQEVGEIRAKFKSLGNKRLIGFSWMTTNEKTAVTRNVPLAQWGPIFETPGCLFFSIQHFGQAQQVAQLRAQNGYNVMVDPGFDPAADVDKLATIIAAMDEVISIQNANIHLGGALGVPTTMMLSEGSDFRWLNGRSDNLWYQSVRMERQTKALVWEEVVAKVAADLRARVTKDAA